MASPSYTSNPKKHKKHHKRDRLESPSPGGLKLILKVGSQATPEHVTEFASGNLVYGGDDMLHASGSYLSGKSHHKKSKKKKKKKDKKERKHRHHHKKRKREEYEDTDENFTTTTGLGSPSQHREPRTCVLRKIQERTPLQKMLDQLLSLLEKKDPQQFFAWPVTDSIAPGYSSIITQPMDFSTMRQKIEDNQYGSLQDFIGDFKLMCTNAMKYNHIDTIYYKASKKLLHAGLKIMQPEKLGWVINLIPELTSDDTGFEITPELRKFIPHQSTPPTQVGNSGNLSGNDEGHDSDHQLHLPEPVSVTPVLPPSVVSKKKMPISKFEAISDDLTAEEILAKSQCAAREARAKLVQKRGGPTTMGFLKQRKDGTTNLNILVGGDGIIPGTKKRPVLLGQLCGKLQEGNGQIQGFREDRRNITKPIKPLYYGAFGSYAPSYDSAFSNLTKEESDLIYHTYGNDAAVQYAESVLDFVKENDYAVHLVDSLLDLLTGGDHMKTKITLMENKKLREEEDMLKQVLEIKPLDSVKINLTELKTLDKVLGVDMNFLDNMDMEIKLNEERNELQERLNAMCELLEKLQQEQQLRLSQSIPQHLNQCAKPSGTEVDLADSITDNLTDIVKRCCQPGDVAPVGGIRKALGVNLPVQDNNGGTQENDVPDLESELRQFLESDPALSNSPLRDDKTIEEILME